VKPSSPAITDPRARLAVDRPVRAVTATDAPTSPKVFDFGQNFGSPSE
jgi:hypothetical protein